MSYRCILNPQLSQNAVPYLLHLFTIITPHFITMSLKPTFYQYISFIMLHFVEWHMTLSFCGVIHITLSFCGVTYSALAFCGGTHPTLALYGVTHPAALALYGVTHPARFNIQMYLFWHQCTRTEIFVRETPIKYLHSMEWHTQHLHSVEWHTQHLHSMEWHTQHLHSMEWHMTFASYGVIHITLAFCGVTHPILIDTTMCDTKLYKKDILSWCVSSMPITQFRAYHNISSQHHIWLDSTVR